MFFSGMEISNVHFLYQYNIKNDYKIQVMRIPKLKTNEKKEEKNLDNNELKNEKKKVKKMENKNEKESEGEEVINNNDGVERLIFNSILLK